MRERVLTAVLLASLTMSALASTAIWPIILFGGVVILLGSREIARLFGAPSPVFTVCAALALYGFFLAPLREGRNPPWLSTIPLGFSLVGIGIAYLRARNANRNYPFAPLEVLWLVGPVLALVLLHRHRLGDGRFRLENVALMALIPVWVGDITAIFVGRQFGRHLIAPSISPKKTVEGAVANLSACIFAAALTGQWLGFSLAPALLCGLIGGTLGQLGDLFESYIKRQAGMKDSGSLLPGHGGILDRIDSLLFTTPGVLIVLSFWPSP